MSFSDFIGITLFCATLCTPFVAYVILEKRNMSGVAKLTVGALIAAILSLVLIVAGLTIIFRGGIC